MHFTFIPYGNRRNLEFLFRDMESQKLKLAMTKEGQPDKAAWISGQIRVLPFGVVDYVFPKEYLDLVLNTLCVVKPNRYTPPKLFVAALRKMLKLEPVPKSWKTGEKFLWEQDNVTIMPLGIRHDSELVEPIKGEYEGYTHESL